MAQTIEAHPAKLPSTEPAWWADLERRVLDYWFGGDGDTVTLDGAQFRKWSAKLPEVDEEVRRLFLADYERMKVAARRWKPASASEALAAVLVLDQFPRHMFRGTRRMYETDDLALALARDALRGDEHCRLSLARRVFLYMPLMHSESLRDQNRMIELYGGILMEAVAQRLPDIKFFEMTRSFAERHRDIVRRFGRFPHRNDILGRRSTPEEAAFLKEPDSSF